MLLYIQVLWRTNLYSVVTKKVNKTFLVGNLENEAGF